MSRVVAAIVVVYDAPRERIDACLDSLHASTGVEVHVTVVDNGSADGGAAAAAVHGRPRTTLVALAHNGGFAAGVNAGLRVRTMGVPVFLLNDDATVHTDTLAHCLRVLDDGGERCIAVAPKVLLANEPERIDSVGTVLRSNGEAFNAGIGQLDRDQFPDRTQVFGACFGAALFRHDAFDVVGPLDERFFLYYEDIDWNIRAYLQGLITLSATQAVALHAHATSTRLLGEPRRYALVQRNLLLCMTKHLPLRAVGALWMHRIVVHLKGGITGPYRRARVRAVTDALAGLPSVLRARRAPFADDPSMYRFAEGLEPYFDTTTYRSSTSGAD